MSDLLTVRNLSKRFGDKRALADFDISLDKGRVHGLLGVNGAGKTTLIKILTGVIPPDAGEICYDGRPVGFAGEAHRRKIGYVPEDPFFYQHMSVRRFLDFNAAFFPNWDRRRADHFLTRFSLSSREKIGGLSRGMKLKLGLLAALAQNPELLILDDPTSGLDVPTRRDFLKDIIGEISEAGTTVLFATHLVHELERIVERVHLIDGGRRRWSENADELKARTKLVRLFYDGAVPDQITAPSVLSVVREGSVVEAVVHPWEEGWERGLGGPPPLRVETDAMSLEDIFMAFITPAAAKGESR